VWPEAEFDEIVAILKTVLPTTFRIGPRHAQALFTLPCISTLNEH